MDLCRRGREFPRSKRQSVKRPGSGASDHQDKHAAGYREVLLEMKKLVSDREILVKQNRCRQTEQTQSNRAETRVPANRNCNASQLLQGDRCDQQRRRHPHFAHAFAAGPKFEARVRPSCTNSQARSNRLASKTASSSFATCFSNARVIALLPIWSIERGSRGGRMIARLYVRFSFFSCSPILS